MTELSGIKDIQQNIQISALRDKLATNALALGFNLTDTQLQQCMEYIQLLSKWNASFNLSAVRDPLTMVERHIIDSLTVLPYISKNTQRLIDVGSGAGLPGLIIAIMRPDIDVTLLDSNLKKTRFLLQAKIALNLDHCHIEQSRVETFNPERQYDCITTRAFASLAKTLAQTQHLAHADSQWLAMKAKDLEQELAGLNPHQYQTTVNAITLPDSDVDRHLVIISKRQTPGL